jgi:hypothetical protein
MLRAGRKYWAELQRGDVAGGAPSHDYTKFDFVRARGGFEKDGVLDRAGIDHGDQPASKLP